MTPKLFIPGPVAVSERTFQAMSHPMVGHRGGIFADLYNSVQGPLQTLFGTTDPVFLSTSSAWGVMEGAIRNLVKKKVLCCMCGAFSDKWLDVARRCGKQAEGYQVEWGDVLDPEEIRKHLSTGDYDTITIVHNETSTGAMNPLADIMKVVGEFPEVFSIVDTVSSFSAVAIPKDELGIDVLLTGSQKALALPPGLALFSVSKRAMERAKTVQDRGYYFDFVEFLKNHEQSSTPSTPCISLIFGLQSKLDEIFTEGLEKRYERHIQNNEILRDWVADAGFELLPKPEYSSRTLVCVKNTRNLDMSHFNKRLKQRFNCEINTGYGKLKGITFRISNMGDETPQTMRQLVDQLNAVLEEMS